MSIWEYVGIGTVLIAAVALGKYVSDMLRRRRFMIENEKAYTEALQKDMLLAINHAYRNRKPSDRILWEKKSKSQNEKN